MKNYLSIALVLFSLLTVRPAFAQQYSPFGLSQSEVQQPVTAFRSTSVMPGSGSAWQSQPVIGANGTAEYPAPSYAPSYAPSGPRRIGPPTPGKEGDDDDEDPTPIGDGTECLLLLLALYAAATGWHRYKRKQESYTA